MPGLSYWTTLCQKINEIQKEIEKFWSINVLNSVSFLFFATSRAPKLRKKLVMTKNLVTKKIVMHCIYNLNQPPESLSRIRNSKISTPNVLSQSSPNPEIGNFNRKFRYRDLIEIIGISINKTDLWFASCIFLDSLPIFRIQKSKMNIGTVSGRHI